MFEKKLKRGTVLLDDDDAMRITSLGCLNIRKDLCVLVKEYIGWSNGKSRFKAHYVSRVVMKAPKGVEVDHVNRNRLDNRKCNLRIATRTQNEVNKGKRSGSKNKMKGVQHVPRNRKNPWMATVSINNRAKHLGYFPSEIAAARAYNEAVRKIHGDYAYTNPV